MKKNFLKIFIICLIALFASMNDVNALESIKINTNPTNAEIAKLIQVINEKDILIKELKESQQSIIQTSQGEINKIIGLTQFLAILISIICILFSFLGIYLPYTNSKKIEKELRTKMIEIEAKITSQEQELQTQKQKQYDIEKARIEANEKFEKAVLEVNKNNQESRHV